ncbi:unnamed protein product, partial [Rotaria sp. Silwood2]
MFRVSSPEQRHHEKPTLLER